MKYQIEFDQEIFDKIIYLQDTFNKSTWVEMILYAINVMIYIAKIHKTDGKFYVQKQNGELKRVIF
ncbi:MAG: hypothetical protein R3321_08305 [Nitrososphaeraceae archaeon]|nr:hypothetical protein [Nitrososphaeraceae archaeon]